MTPSFLGTSYGGVFLIEGVDVWSQQWERVPKTARIEAIDPQYGVEISCTVFELQGPARAVRFAAHEISNGVWLFFDPSPKENRRAGPGDMQSSWRNPGDG
jgi:hypothetical protein